MKFLIFLGFLLPIKHSFSQTFETNIYNYELNPDEINLIHLFISKTISITHPFISEKIKNVEINILPKTNINLFALSNANPNDCKISLFIEPGNLEKEDFFVFSLSHEFAHCYLGKDIFFKPIKWETISLEQAEKINNQLFYETILKKENKNNKTHSLIILHEISADIFSIYWTTPFYPNLISLISSERNIEQSEFKDQSQHYFIDFNKMDKNLILNRQYSDKDLTIFIEKTFIPYIKNQILN